MDESYTFSATVAERWPDGLQIVPDDWPAFVAYIERVGITTNIHWHPKNYVSVGSRPLVERAGSAERVQYTIQPKDTARGREIEAIDLQPLLLGKTNRGRPNSAIHREHSPAQAPVASLLATDGVCFRHAGGALVGSTVWLATELARPAARVPCAEPDAME